MISDARRGHVSPGIYTEEKDVLYTVKSLGITSLGLVGETLYGPAFQNIEITNWGEFVDYFGGTSPEKFKGTGKPKYELPYIAKSYLEESKKLNVVRVLGLSGYNAGKVWVIKNGNKPVIILRSRLECGIGSSLCEETNNDMPTEIVKSIKIGQYKGVRYTSNCEIVESTNNETENVKNKFSITVKTINGDEKTYNVSLNPNDSDYIYNVISSNPENEITPIYIEAVYESSFDEEFTPTVETLNPCDDKEYNDYKEGYRAAQTPWIVSDAVIKQVGENTEAYVRKLFKFITISDGTDSNFQVKISIENIDVKYGTFDVIVRDFNDTDANPLVLESFRKCNLIEGDSNYIAYKIGTADGGYVSKSKYILVIMADGDDFGKSIPAGFLGYPMPSYGIEGREFDMLYNTLYNPSIKTKRQYFGLSNIIGIDSDVFTYKGKYFTNNELPENITSGFHMDSAMPTSENSRNIFVDGVSGYVFTSVSKEKVTNSEYTPRLINANYIDKTLYGDIKTRKFTVCFYGGFDGWDVNRTSRTNTNEYKSTNYNVKNSNVFSSVINENDLNLPLNLPSTAITSDYYAYLAGCRVFANPQDIDINIFATPGINWGDNSLLTNEIVDIIEDSEDGRGGDAIYVMASPSDDSYYGVDEIINAFEDSDINSSYACTYFPWVMYYDENNKRYINLPVTKDVVKNMAATDNNSFPWFAPAGTERGKVKCIKAVYKTTLADEDALYNASINPVKSFAQDGVIIWGNKTAYPLESPLNRINVRRMMIRVKKLITNAAKHLIFEQYDETLEKQFRGIVEPILADVKANRGIIDYRVIIESTPETRDQHILPAKILIKPTQALEYISISFVVYPESVSFENE